MKSNEQARGTPLAGYAVKVTDGQKALFLVGLSNIESHPRRAIIAIEKGAPGERASTRHSRCGASRGLAYDFRDRQIHVLCSSLSIIFEINHSHAIVCLTGTRGWWFGWSLRLLTAIGLTIFGSSLN